MNLKNLMMWGIIVLLVVGLFQLFQNPNQTQLTKKKVTFSNFLDRKILRQGKVGLNTKLYRKDLIHFSDVGNSVLAKVIIGVTYNPY